jgi:hypothetical protein
VFQTDNLEGLEKKFISRHNSNALDVSRCLLMGADGS